MAKASAWLPRGLARPGHGKPAWRWERLCAADGSDREDDDWQLLNRDGRMVARVRQEGSGYWVARPRIVPEPPIESFKDSCRRAVSAAMATLEPWPETERHPVHPGMTASQFKATCRDWQRKYPDLSDEEIERRVAGILRPLQQAELIGQKNKLAQLEPVSSAAAYGNRSALRVFRMICRSQTSCYGVRCRKRSPTASPPDCLSDCLNEKPRADEGRGFSDGKRGAWGAELPVRAVNADCGFKFPPPWR